MTPDEKWLPVVGYEGYYEVSDQGRVRSLTRRVYAGRGRDRISEGRVLSPYLGDHYVKVRLKRDASGATKNVHQLVAEAFLGPRPEGMEVCHDNGQNHDNRVENLRYDTHSANQFDKVRHGSDHLAKRTHCNQGHAFTAENTIRRENGARRCRTCDRARTTRRVANGEFRKKAS